MCSSLCAKLPKKKTAAFCSFTGIIAAGKKSPQQSGLNSGVSLFPRLSVL